MKIILVGPGSIGRRHLHNLLHLGYTDVTVVSRSGQLPEALSHLPVFTSLSAALSSSRYEAAVVCTPTSFHIPAVTALLQAKVPNIYIEKPASHSLEGLNEIMSLAEAYENNIVVGYDLHFDPGLQKVKELLDSTIFGNVVSVNAQVGQYLPDWRPAEDYRKGMSAKKETGGGVMLDLIHEFDYLLWLIGPVKTVACQYANSGALEIETEDVCDVLLRFANGATGTIHLDYLQQKLLRNCVITCCNGTIYWNLATSKVEWINNGKEEVFAYQGYERNNRFIAIMRAFLENTSDPRLTNLTQGIQSLQLVVAAKHSSENGVFVDPSTFQISSSTS